MSSFVGTDATHRFKLLVALPRYVHPLRVYTGAVIPVYLKDALTTSMERLLCSLVVGETQDTERQHLLAIWSRTLPGLHCLFIAGMLDVSAYERVRRCATFDAYGRALGQYIVWYLRSSAAEYYTHYVNMAELWWRMFVPATVHVSGVD